MFNSAMRYVCTLSKRRLKHYIAKHNVYQISVTLVLLGAKKECWT